jgi:hypothetical protein
VFSSAIATPAAHCALVGAVQRAERCITAFKASQSQERKSLNDIDRAAVTMAVAETAYFVPQVSATTLKNTKSLLKILILGSIAGERCTAVDVHADAVWKHAAAGTRATSALLESLLLVLIIDIGYSAGAAVASRLFAVIRFESIIHEFDPWRVSSARLEAQRT